VSKSTAKSAAPAKKAVKKPAAAAPKPAPKKVVAPKKAPAAKKPAKPAPKAPAKKAAPAGKAGAKATPKTPTKTAPKSAHPPAKSASKPTAGPVTKTTTKTPLKPATAPATKPVAKPVPKAPETKAAVPAATPAAKPATKPSRSGHSKAVAQPIPAAPETQVSRFADRFAPARPTRPVAMPEPFRPPVRVDPKLANAWKNKAGRDLTDDELLAMPESEYMGERQLEFFRVRLTALKDDLLSNAGETTEHLREDTSIVPDPADRATIEEEHALELRTRDRERKLLKKISQSLARIEAGDYGYCDETGEPIGLARLLARPTATLSLEAQQRREMKQKMFGD